jgi:hypothetical protein
MRTPTDPLTVGELRLLLARHSDDVEISFRDCPPFYRLKRITPSLVRFEFKKQPAKRKTAK